jgi:hypothetical protein
MLEQPFGLLVESVSKLPIGRPGGIVWNPNEKLPPWIPISQGDCSGRN